jgi:uncharacterized protein YfeS
MQIARFYFDDQEEEGLARETSHPNFVAAFTAEFYYDCTDDFSPFGNDWGADLHYKLEDWYRKTVLFRNIVPWMFNLIDQGGFELDSKVYWKTLNIPPIEKMQQKYEHFFEFMDQSIIAACFGQIKITGKLTKELRKITEVVFTRQRILHQPDGSETGELYIQRIDKMRYDLEQFGR